MGVVTWLIPRGGEELAEGGGASWDGVQGSPRKRTFDDGGRAYGGGTASLGLVPKLADALLWVRDRAFHTPHTLAVTLCARRAQGRLPRSAQTSVPRCGPGRAARRWCWSSPTARR